MTTQQEQAYINGFVKKASEYGYSEQEAAGILKEAVNLPPSASLPAGAKAIRNFLAGMAKKPTRAMGAVGAATGGITGGALGGLVGGANGLMNPGQEIDPETGKLVDKSRLMSMLTGGLKGTAVGAGIGGGIGLGSGLGVGTRLSKDLADPMVKKLFRQRLVDAGKLV